MKTKWILLAIVVASATFAQAKLEMAITIDDLPVHGKLPPGVSRVDVAKSMLSTLKKYQVPEVYGFINAHKVDQERDTIEVLSLWIKAGYPLGNHTFSHRNINKVSVDEFKKEIEENESLLKTLSGPFEWHYFRYPFLVEGDNLEKRNAVRASLKNRSYTIAQVTDDFEDWAWNDPYARCKENKDEKSIEWLKKSYLDLAQARFIHDGKVAAAVFHRPISRILLLHIGAFDAEMLPRLLRMYKENGVEFISLSQALKDPIYKEDPNVVTKRGETFPYQMMFSKNLTTKDIGSTPGTEFPEDKLNSICARSSP